MVQQHAVLHRIVGIAAVATVIAGGCGTSDSKSSATTPSSAAPTTTAPPTTTWQPLWAAPDDAAFAATVATSLQKKLDDYVQAVKAKGVSAAVVSIGGTWSGAAGVDAAGAKIEPTSAMSIASVTKTFIAAEVMLLSSRGLVNLDAPLAGYVSIPFGDNGATVRQVLAMRSGFPEIPFDTVMGTVARDLNREWTAADVLATIPASQSLDVPGDKPRYTNSNYVMLGLMIEKITGNSLGDVLRRDLIGPAGLERAWTQTGDTPTAPLTVGTNPGSAGMVDAAGPYVPSRSAATALAGAGQMAADAPSIARWGYLLYGGHVISPILVKQMESEAEVVDNLNGVPYALGTMIDTVNVDVIFGHAGGNTGWPYSTVMLVWTEPPISVAVTVPEPVPADGDFRAAIAFALHDVVSVAITSGS